jgi:putative Mg2+ transporter-C (MgtC) family protein
MNALLHSITDTEILIRFLLAALWGGIVGTEREYRSKSAGFRTMIMISVGSCFFTIMSMVIGDPNNPDRIASNIVTGIGFLGAGVIFRGENRVNGITTAASIWAVAAVGMGIGAGYYFAAAAASLLIVVVLALLPYGEKLIDHFNLQMSYEIHCDFSIEKRVYFEQLFKDHRLKIHLVKEAKEANELSVRWQVQGRRENHDRITAIIIADQTVRRLERF